MGKAPDFATLNSVFSPGVPYVLRGVFLSFLVLFSSVFILAQDDGMPLDVAPPPLKIMSKEEKTQLESESGVKDKTSLYLTFMDARLKRAEELSSQDSFADSMSQFGIYHGLLEGLMDFLKNENKSNKALGGFKKLEMALRAHNVRIETVRRIMPFQYAYHVSQLQRYVRRTRGEATESLFSDSVVPGAVEKKATPTDGHKPE